MIETGENRLGHKTFADWFRRNEAFTLTELLVVIVIVAILAVVVLPAVAGIQNKGGRADCANNLRQIGQDSMIFAGENNGWLPICTVGAGNSNTSNHLNSIVYTYYVFSGATANMPLSTNSAPAQGSYQNAGYLFEAGLAGNGSIFYCPAQWGDPKFGANAYTPLLTADSSGTVRSSYFYNPRMVNAFSGNTLRRYQTVSQLEPHKLFAMDGLLSTPTPPLGEAATGVNPATIQHARDHGWNVLFTDGSVQFAQLTATNSYFYNLIVNNLSSSYESENSYEEYDQVFDFLEQDH